MAKLKILIVDDSIVIRERLRSMLSDLRNVGAIAEAANYTEAMMAIATADPDIIILDINMPEKNGLDVLFETKLLQHPPLVIMLSNYSDSYYRDLCEKKGADYFFDKSTEFEKVPDVLNAFVRV